jgi:hypothetical protein
VVTVSSNVIAGYNSNEVIAEMKDALTGYEKDERFGMAFTGQQEDQMKEMRFLGKAFMIALFIVFLIIVWQFNSVSYPMVILSTVLFSTIGVFLGPGGVPHGFHHPHDDAGHHLTDRRGGEQCHRAHGFRAPALRPAT